MWLIINGLRKNTEGGFYHRFTIYKITNPTLFFYSTPLLGQTTRQFVRFSRHVALPLLDTVQERRVSRLNLDRWMEEDRLRVEKARGGREFLLEPRNWTHISTLFISSLRNDGRGLRRSRGTKEAGEKSKRASNYPSLLWNLPPVRTSWKKLNFETP